MVAQAQAQAQAQPPVKKNVASQEQESNEAQVAAVGLFQLTHQSTLKKVEMARASAPTAEWSQVDPIRPNASTIKAILASSMEEGGKEPTTELDSHANMDVVRKHLVNTQMSTHSVMSAMCDHLQQIPIVNAAVAYDYPYSGKTFLLIMKNLL